MNCPNSFTFWFMRPIAEFLGGLALVAAFMALMGLGIAAWVAYDTYVERRKRKQFAQGDKS